MHFASTRDKAILLFTQNKVYLQKNAARPYRESVSGRRERKREQIALFIIYRCLLQDKDIFDMFDISL